MRSNVDLDDDEAGWTLCDEPSGLVLAFPEDRLRRFVAVQFVGPGQWRAAIFIGWHLDPRRRPGPIVESHAAALEHARGAGRKCGLRVIEARYHAVGCGVWSWGDTLEPDGAA